MLKVIECENCGKKIISEHNSRKYCKKCSDIKKKESKAKSNRLWCLKNKDKIKAIKKRYDDEYRDKNGCSYSNIYQKNNRKKTNINQKVYYYKNKEIRRIKGNIRKKTLILLKQRNIDKNQNCYICGNAGAHIHHNDYSNPFNITFLCKVCHGRLHMYFKNNYNINPDA